MHARTRASEYLRGWGILLLGTVCPTVQSEVTELTEPKPWRREAVIEGRDFNYNAESFLQRYSYRPFADGPLPDEDGIAASAGSVTGNQLYVDMHFQKTLLFDPAGLFTFRMQRQEDLDGRYDRQLVGFGADVGDWRITLFGDVTADKSQADIQLEAAWNPDPATRLHLALMLPEAFLNDKSINNQHYDALPWGVFAGFEHHWSNSKFRSRINYFPPIQYQEEELALEADQLLLSITLTLPFLFDTSLSFQVDAEQADRTFDFNDPASGRADEYYRDMQAVTLSWELPKLPYRPLLGLRHLRLEENGWFGTTTDLSGSLSRDEPMLFLSASMRSGERHEWVPTVYIAHVKASQPERKDNGDVDEKSFDRWIGKLALPWRYQVADDGKLTLNPSLDLHQLGFGGGNVQLHWLF